MRTRTWVTFGVIGALVLGAGGYAAADVAGVVPGPLTLASPGPGPSPFPTVTLAAGSHGPALGDLDPHAPLPSDAAVQAKVDALAADPRMGPSVGVIVADQLTGAVIAQRSAQTGRQPASIAKTLTAVAALTALDPDGTLPTTAVLKGDQLVLVGGGDTLLSENAGDPSAVDGRAGLGDLAAQAARALKKAGVSAVSLAVDDTLFTGPSVAPGWDPSDLTNGFVAPVSALALHGARIDPSKEYSARYTDPAMAAGQAFATRLAEQGITVDGPVGRAAAPAGARNVGTVRSAPLRDVVGYFLGSSDNTLTEVVARLVAVHEGKPATFEGATSAVLDVVATLGVDTTGAHLADASGLAEGSSVAATTFLGVIEQATSAKRPALRDVVAMLPIAGLTGTLDNRYTTSAARGLIRAKTGSLAGVTSLAGTMVTADGRALDFVVMADQTPGQGQSGARAAIDGFVSDLAACGCR